jgi:putative transposase
LATEGKVNISSVCCQLGYSKQAYYKSRYLRTLKSCKYTIAKDKVLELRAEMPRLGTRKLHYLIRAELDKQAVSMGRDKLFNFLRKEDLLIVKKKKYTVTTDSRHWMHKYPNEIKQMKIIRPEQVWVADITYISLTDKPCFLHLVTDAYSKQIMGYHASESLAATCTVKALEMALKNRKYNGKLIHHSDRGLQYCSNNYTNLLKQEAITISMTQDGSPYDNAIAERINGILKDEFGMGETFKDLKDVERQIKEAVQVYNKKRPHMSNHLLTPEQMHEQDILEPKAWHKKPKRILRDSFGFLPSLPIH